ncbi:hypothetical protein ACH4ZX_03765 [Streptomyces sp. NPDC020490]|uniref:hypothetical protein n=1 Tax=Streptomyces sp. NPDC020490 TaxID=3365078 RepID=UPI003795B151
MTHGTSTPQPQPTPAPWPESVIARYLTVGGATVDLTERSGYYNRTEPTETYVACGGCLATHTVEWGWSGYADEYDLPQDNFDEGGKRSTPKAREWAQSHAERCRAMPRPAVTA